MLSQAWLCGACALAIVCVKTQGPVATSDIGSDLAWNQEVYTSGLVHWWLNNMGPWVLNDGSHRLEVTTQPRRLNPARI
eukprot:15468539-Alexandrium_andersonii.AAC.1